MAVIGEYDFKVVHIRESDGVTPRTIYMKPNEAAPTGFDLESSLLVYGDINDNSPALKFITEDTGVAVGDLINLSADDITA